MIASARQIIYADRFIREGRRPQAQISLGRSVGKKTMGVVGFGAIGRPIADRGAAFNMRVLYYVPRRKPDAPYEYVADVVELARQSDFLMVACKGGPDTCHLIGRDVIEALGSNGTLVNVARGSVVDEQALAAALRDGRPGYAALDVFENEPHVSTDLLALPNVIVQPHHGSAGLETRIAMGQLDDRQHRGLDRRAEIAHAGSVGPPSAPLAKFVIQSPHPTTRTSEAEGTS